MFICLYDRIVRTALNRSHTDNSTSQFAILWLAGTLYCSIIDIMRKAMHVVCVSVILPGNTISLLVYECNTFVYVYKLTIQTLAFCMQSFSYRSAKYHRSYEHVNQFEWLVL